MPRRQRIETVVAKWCREGRWKNARLLVNNANKPIYTSVDKVYFIVRDAEERIISQRTKLWL